MSTSGTVNLANTNSLSTSQGLLKPITITGQNSGLPVSDIIAQLVAVEQRPITDMQNKVATIQNNENIYNAIKAQASTLSNDIKLLVPDPILGNTTTDLFSAKSVTVANTALASATADSSAVPQSFSLEVLSTATQTKAQSQSAVGQYITSTTPLNAIAMGSATAGTFTIFDNGVAHTVTVNSGDTVGTVLNSITAAVPQITATITSGQIVLSSPNTETIQLGSTSDTSNFLAATQLSTGLMASSGGNNTITSRNPILGMDPSAVINTAAAGMNTPVTAGTFTINGKTFDTTGLTLSQVLSNINNGGAQVFASFDSTTNKINMSSTVPGSALINMADGTGNFLTATGLIVGGNSTTSQTAGANASFKINGGPTLYSASNSVTASTTGLTGITLNLTQASPGSPTTVNVTRNTGPLTQALTAFVNDFNALTKTIATQTKSDQNASNRGPLSTDSQLKSFMGQLRTLVTSSVPGLVGTGFDSLPTAGISTGASTGVLNTDNTLKLAGVTLESALSSNFQAVKKLFIGVAATDGVDGIMTQMNKILTSSLGTTATTGADGIFAASINASNTQITQINSSITAAQTRLQAYQTSLQKQYTAMEQLIAQYQSQSTAVAGLNPPTTTK